jgi:hypothetical protein
MSPIRAENLGRYPDNWKAISEWIRFSRALGHCECEGECGRTHKGRCPNRHGQPAYGTGSNVILTVAHLNHTPEDCRDENLKAMCQGCHLHYDREHHAQTAARTRAALATEGMDPLFGLPGAKAGAASATLIDGKVTAWVSPALGDAVAAAGLAAVVLGRRHQGEA